MYLLKQNAPASGLIGPVLGTEGDPVTTAVISDFSITKGGGTSPMGAPSTVTHSHNGYYFLYMSQNDTNFTGGLSISVNASGMFMGNHSYLVVPSAVYNSFESDNTVNNIKLIPGLL